MIGYGVDWMTTAYPSRELRAARRYARVRWWRRMYEDYYMEYVYHDRNHCRGRCGRHKWA